MDVIDLILKRMLKEMIWKLVDDAGRGYDMEVGPGSIEIVRAYNRYHTMFALQLLLTIEINEKWIISTRYTPRPTHWKKFQSQFETTPMGVRTQELVSSIHHSNRVHKAYYYECHKQQFGVKDAELFISGNNVYYWRKAG